MVLIGRCFSVSFVASFGIISEFSPRLAVMAKVQCRKVFGSLLFFIFFLLRFLRTSQKGRGRATLLLGVFRNRAGFKSMWGFAAGGGIIRGPHASKRWQIGFSPNLISGFIVSCVAFSFRSLFIYDVLSLSKITPFLESLTFLLCGMPHTCHLSYENETAAGCLSYEKFKHSPKLKLEE
ncbi:hypothetical protein V6N12_041467 [Hibiscus sabdariffa]|uniref:Uncharacterized protein n=1 Tax=Hibiscus sabdariffa TaxID=183260 RepID=A0ABR2AHF2_9ROSI